MSIKNTKNILIKNIGDASLGAICWWLLGYGVAFGETTGELTAGCIDCCINLARTLWLWCECWLTKSRRLVFGGLGSAVGCARYLMEVLSILATSTGIIKTTVSQVGWVYSPSI